MTDTPPTRQRRWQRRASVATGLRVAVVVVRILVTAIAAVGMSRLLPAPDGLFQVAGWWIAVIGAGVAASLATERVARRMAPLAILYDLSLTFPDATPSRWRLARQVRDVDDARARLLAVGDRADATLQEAVEAALALIASLETHDGRTRGHSERVRLLTEMIAHEMGIHERDRVKLRWSAVLHDLGKLTVHAPLLNKRGALSDEEWESLRRHPIEGARYAAPLRPWLGDWVDSVEQHHERWDGRGYPHGLAGREISLGGRIVAVADAYEAMTANRGYNQPMRAEEARRELVAESGAQFDPEVVRAFLGVSLPELRKVGGWWAWVGSLPIIGLVGRVPREATTVAVAGAVALAAGLVTPSESGLHAPDGERVQAAESPADPAPPPVSGPSLSPSASADGVAPPDGGGDEAAVLGIVLERDDVDEASGPDPADEGPQAEGPSSPAPEEQPAGEPPADEHGQSDDVLESGFVLLGDEDSQDVTIVRPLGQESLPDRAPQFLPLPGSGVPVPRSAPSWSLAVPAGAASLGTSTATLHLVSDAPTTLELALHHCDEQVVTCTMVGHGFAEVAASDRAQPVDAVLNALPVAEIDDGVIVLSLGQDGDADLRVAFSAAATPSSLELTAIVPSNLAAGRGVPDHGGHEARLPGLLSWLSAVRLPGLLP